MKLFTEYLLLDGTHKFVLRLNDDSPEHMRYWRDVYSIIYKHRAPLHIAAVDALGDIHILEMDDEADQPLRNKDKA